MELVDEAIARIEMPYDIHLALNEGDYEKFDRAALNSMIRMLGEPGAAQGVAPLMRSEGYQWALKRVHDQTDYGD